MSKPVSVIKCEDYEVSRLEDVIIKHFENLGGIEKFIKKGTKVLIKPNLIMGKAPDTAVTTHPAFIEALAKVIIKNGGVVTIADSPGGPFTPILLKTVYKSSGMDKAAKNCGASLNYDCSADMLPFRDGVICHEFHFIKPYFDADLLITACKLKTHSMTAYTGAVKNLFGLIPGLEKPELHSRFPKLDRFGEMLVDLCAAAKPALAFMDAITVHEGNGPTGGRPKHAGLTLASENPFSLDLAATYIAGFDKNEVITVKKSIERGLTENSVADLDIIGEKLDDVLIRDLLRAKTDIISMFSVLPPILRVGLDKLIDPHPKIQLEKCVGCGKCAESCPAHTIEISDRKAHINYSRCIRCFCCQEMCPIKAIAIKRNILFRHR
ncbi:MAG: DUF362 domain-containing protein [Bacillota bacterium]|nr:DUF362 domain-containing protein [Bacillota bacterium]